MTEDDLSADRRAVLPQLAKSALIESAAMGVVSIGRALFKHSEPSDPELQLRTVPRTQGKLGHAHADHSAGSPPVGAVG